MTMIICKEWMNVKSCAMCNNKLWDVFENNDSNLMENIRSILDRWIS